MDLSTLANICMHVSTLPVAENWCRCDVVVSYEFDSIDEFMAAYHALCRACLDTPLYVSCTHPRRPRSDTVEITLYDVTFRLVCRKVMMSEHGAHGAADLIGYLASDASY